MNMETIKKELSNQTTISYFELGVFEGMVIKKNVPHDSDSLILAIARVVFPYPKRAMVGFFIG
jgi:hypothetical protein